MSARTFAAGLLLLTAFFAVTASSEETWKIYYDLEGQPIPLVGTAPRQNTQRYGWPPCTCQDYTCGCCMGLNASFVNFSRSACMNFTYLPLDFTIEMNVLMNDESVFKRNMSAKNPPPACMEVPINYLPSMQFCIKVFDIYTPGRNLHMCVDFETRIERAPLLVLQFDCFVMGSDGLSNEKPTKKPSGSSSEASTNQTKAGNHTEVIISIPSQLTTNATGTSSKETLQQSVMRFESNSTESSTNNTDIANAVNQGYEVTSVPEKTTVTSFG